MFAECTLAYQNRAFRCNSTQVNQPLVCVAIPSYKQQEFIGEAIESVINQSYQNIRIVISDDGSPDATPNIIRDYIARYPGKIVAQFHKTNLGVTENSRSMASLIEGDYLCWLAGDDVFLPNKIAKQVAALEANKSAVMCYHDMEVFEHSTNRTLYRYNEPGPGLKPFQGDIVRQLLVRRCFVGANSLMLRRAAVNDVTLRSELRRVSDWVYIIEVACRGPVIYLDEALVRYRRHASNLSRYTDIADERVAYALLENILPEYAHEIALGHARLELSYLFQYGLAGRFKEAFDLGKSLVGRVSQDPSLTPFLVRALSELFVQRFHLFHRTGKLRR